MEKRNYVKACEHLCITRSPLYKIITDIEKTTGNKLFISRHTEVEPTQIAYSLYEQCKEHYEGLSSIDEALYNKKRKPIIHVNMDISIPEMVFRHLATTLTYENNNIKFQRSLLNSEDLKKIQHQKDQFLISLRKIPYAGNCYCDKWPIGGFAILQPEHHPHDRSLLPILIWKDNYTSYLKQEVIPWLCEDFSNIRFSEHNLELSCILYKIRQGDHCTILPEKFSKLFKLNGMDIKNIKRDKIHYVYLYKSNNSSDEFINHVKHSLNEVL